jgi:hypothetical protein
LRAGAAAGPFDSRWTAVIAFASRCWTASDMQRISSKMTFYYKRVLPVIMLGFIGVFVVFGLGIGSSSGKFPPLPFFVMPIIIGTIMFFMMKKLIFDLVDEVWDAGDTLIVRNKGQEERIALSEIMNVNYSPMMNPPRVTLSLRRPSTFGDKVTFCAPSRFVPFASSPIIDELIARVDAARGRAR